jgi:hypothetical protein
MTRSNILTSVRHRAGAFCAQRIDTSFSLANLLTARNSFPVRSSRVGQGVHHRRSRLNYGYADIDGDQPRPNTLETA